MMRNKEQRNAAFSQVYGDCLAYLDIISEGYIKSGRFESLTHSYHELSMALLQNIPNDLPEDIVSRVAGCGVTYAEMVSVGMKREMSRFRL